MFYKLENGELIFGETVATPNFILVQEEKDNYEYPMGGWYWFNSQEAAESYFALNKPETFIVNSVVSMRQARLELLNRNLLDKVDEMITQMPRSAQIEWEYATEIKRNNPLVIQLTNALNLTSADMDEFYRVAATL